MMTCVPSEPYGRWTRGLLAAVAALSWLRSRNRYGTGTIHRNLERYLHVRPDRACFSLGGRS